MQEQRTQPTYTPDQTKWRTGEGGWMRWLLPFVVGLAVGWGIAELGDHKTVSPTVQQGERVHD